MNFRTTNVNSTFAEINCEIYVWQLVAALQTGQILLIAEVFFTLFFSMKNTNHKYLAPQPAKTKFSYRKPAMSFSLRYDVQLGEKRLSVERNCDVNGLNENL